MINKRFFFEKKVCCFFKHGESELNVLQRIGGDPPLSPKGKAVLFELKPIFSIYASSFRSMPMHWRNIWLAVS
jgi:broad specificity phosphatase PhoE